MTAGQHFDFLHTINGKPVAGPGRFGVINPATAEVFAQAPEATPELLQQAVDAATRAQPAWEAAGWDERARRLLAFSADLERHTDELAELLTLEQGKPLAESKAEIAKSCDNLNKYAKQRIEPVVMRDDANERVEEHYRAAGVAGVISPWNTPLGLFAIRAAPFLMSGSSVISKPSPYTPLTTLRMGELSRAHFPAGVLNVIAGSDPLGQWVVEHPGVHRISFTGSVRTGRKVLASGAEHLKRIALELGGNDPAIIFPDVNVKKIAPRLLWSVFRTCGQICMTIKRLYVHEDIHEELTAELIKLCSAIRVGDGMLPGIEMGPLQNRMQFDIVKRYLEETRALPGTRVYGGEILPGPGYFISPAIVTHVPDDARLVQEEQFGPVLPVLSFRDTEDVIQRANATSYGLSASVWSNDTATATAVAKRIEAGTVWINNHMLLDPDVPFGGWKMSGIGRGNGLSGLQACMEAHAIRLLKQPV